MKKTHSLESAPDQGEGGQNRPIEVPKIITGAHYGASLEEGESRVKSLREAVFEARQLYEGFSSQRVERENLSEEQLKTLTQYAHFKQWENAPYLLVEGFRYDMRVAGATALELRRYRRAKSGDEEADTRVKELHDLLEETTAPTEKTQIKQKIEKLNQRKEREQRHAERIQKATSMLLKTFTDEDKEALKQKLESSGTDTTDALLELRYAHARGRVQKRINEYGPMLEYYHRIILNNEKHYYHAFAPALKERARLKSIIEAHDYLATAKQNEFKEARARLHLEETDAEKTRETLFAIQKEAGYLSEGDMGSILEDPELLAMLEEYAGEMGASDITGVAEALQGSAEKSYALKGIDALKKEKKAHDERIATLWQKEIVRYIAYKEWIKKLIAQDIAGEKSLETPSIMDVMNRINSFEVRQQHSTPIAAVLVGPPGTGKSMLAEHYLRTHPEHKHKGPPIVFDMSKETTSTMLFGGEETDIADKTGAVQMITKMFDSQESAERRLSSQEECVDMENLEKERAFTRTQIRDVITATMARHVEMRIKAGELTSNDSVNQDVEKAGEDIYSSARSDNNLTPETLEQLSIYIKDAISDWKAKELGKIMFGNGWRMGVILRALSEGRDIIINEFDNFVNPPDELRALMQTPYGESWTYEAQGRVYTVNSSFILTANKGLSGEKFDYETHNLTAPIANRIPHFIEMDDLPTNEEIMIAYAELSKATGKFLLNGVSESRLASTEALLDIEMTVLLPEKEMLVYLLEKVVPRLRSLAEMYPGAVPPITLRNLNFFCRELVDPETRTRTSASMEDAFVEYYIKPFRMTPESWEAITSENIIIDDLYRAGLLRGVKHKKLVFEALAKKKGFSLSGNEEARRGISIDLEKELQKIDQELIDVAKENEGEGWEEMIRNAKKKKKLSITTPEFKYIQSPTQFSVSDTPVAKEF
jgi:hypothetical protein